MPSSDNFHRAQTARTKGQEMLRAAAAKAQPTSPPTAAPPSGFFDSTGVKIHYETWGEGYPIVLVHGFASNLKGNWVDTGWVETLRPVRRVVALDCRGFGESDKPHDAAAYEGDTMPQDVLNLMDHLGIEKTDLFGYSMGAFISAALMARHRERFTTVILGGAGNLLDPGREEQMSKSADYLLVDDPSQITDPFGKTFRAIADGIPSNDRLALAACAQRLFEPVEPADFAGVDIPVLVISGANDTEGGNPSAIAAATPGSKLVLIPDTNHFTVIPDQRFKDAVVAFLKEQDEGA
jgi:pimeloyl-ACP methyl ester carboxylesterase